ncbi:MAG: TolC family protein [Bacteroidetes bacterium]|nr:TolC family protein [Bacteroidota bacterium]
MKRILYTVAFLIGSGHSLAAQRILTLEEAISQTLENNWDIRIARNDSIVAAIDRQYRNAGLLPNLNANIGQGFNNNDQYQKFNDGTIRERNDVQSSNLSGNISLSWTLFDGGRMFATRARLDELLAQGEWTIRNQINNTIADVVNAYYRIVQLSQQSIALEKQIAVFEEREKLARHKLNIGVGSKPDLLQSQIDLNSQKSLQLSIQNDILQAKQALNRLMLPKLALNEHTPSDWFEVIKDIPIQTDLSLGTIQDSLSINNPQLQIQQLNIRLAERTLQERKADRYPTFSFNSAYNFNRLDNKVVVNPFQPLFSRNQGLNYGFTASVPLFNQFRVRRQIEQAKQDIRFQEFRFDQQNLNLRLGAWNAFQRYLMLIESWKLEEKNILLTEENVQIVLEIYRLNSTTLLQLKEAQRSLQEAYDRLIRARFQAKLAETELLRLQGKFIH